MNILKNKIALITGGAQGIGRGITLELAKAGADIIIAQRSIAKAEAVVAEVQALGREAMALQFDVTDIASIKRGVQDAFAHFPRIDILVNNAGIVGQAAIAGHTSMAGNECINVTEDFDLCYDVNLKGIWNVTSALIPHFKANQEGKIVNISSVCGRQGAAALPAYCASKAGSISLTQSLASALGSHNINVNTICPGTIDTPGADIFKENLDIPHLCDEAAKLTALNRLATPEDIGLAVVFFVSSQARNITGQALNIDAGWYMH